MESTQSNSYKFVFASAVIFYLAAGFFAAFYFWYHGSAYAAGLFEKDPMDNSKVIGSPASAGREADGMDGSGASEDSDAWEMAALENGEAAGDSSDGSSAGNGAEGAEVSGQAANPSESHYYILKTSTTKQRLHLREAPSLSAMIIYRMPIGTPGYVLWKGNSWAFIVAETKKGVKTGFAAVKYLDLEEIPPEAVPAEYLELNIPQYEEEYLPYDDI